MKNFITIIPFLVILSLSAMASELRIKFPSMEVFHAERDMSSDTLTVTNASGRIILSGRASQFDNRAFQLPAGTYKATLTYFDEETLPLETEFVLGENMGKTLYARHIFNFGPLVETFENQTYSVKRPYYVWTDSSSRVDTIMLVSAGSVLVKPASELFMELNYRSSYFDGESMKCISGISLGRFDINENNLPLLRINNVAASVRIVGKERVASVGRLTVQIPTVANYEIFTKDHADQVTLLTTCLWPDEEHSLRIFNDGTEMILPTGDYVIETLGAPTSFTIKEGETTSLYF